MKRRKSKPKPAPGAVSPSLLSRSRDWYARKSPVLRFVVNFGLLMALLYGLLAMPFLDQWLYGYLKFNAWSASVILNILGQHTHVADVTIESAQFAIAIRRGCDAVEPTWLLCAAILCFPALPARKLLGMLAGIILLQVLNLARIVTLFWIGIRFPAFFNSAHMEVWPMVFIAAAICLFLFWRGWAEQWKPHAPG